MQICSLSYGGAITRLTGRVDGGEALPPL